MIREYLNACDARFISWGMRDSWIICVWSWKFRFPEVSPTMTDSKRDAWILLKFVRETGSRSSLCHPPRTLRCKYRNCYWQKIGLSGWKGCVPYGPGADISLPQCLETGLWSLTHESDQRAEISGNIGTTLWQRVQRHCSIDVLLVHAWFSKNRRPYHIRG